MEEASARNEREGTVRSRRLAAFALTTFGCKVNQVETQVLRERLLGRGLREVDARDGPDLLVVNTCCVTSRGAAESRRYARGMAARYPETRVVVTGCHADVEPEDYEDAGIHLVGGNELKGSLLARLGLGEDGAPFHDATVSGAGGRTRVTVKIQDGCHQRCSYCIVPTARPELRSKDPDVVVREVAGLVERGTREVVLTGIHLGAYGREARREDALAEVVRRLLDETGVPRLRLSSLEAREVTPALLELLATRHDRLAPHLHLPLQSGSDAVLRRMRRPSSAGAYRETVARIRERVPEPALTTDVIVGFPGETEEEAAETLRLCDEIGFLKIHVFRYSDRPGTRACALSGEVPAPVARERSRRVEAVADRTGAAFRDRFLGRTVPVLVENRRRPETGLLTGLTDRYLRVDLPGEDDRMNEIVPVRVASREGDRLLGTPAA
jgi:threonylcarbamoyladenosine tRNA methylthiotransferase MtaB